MKPNIPRSWLTLPKKEQKVIENYVKEVAGKELEREARIILDLEPPHGGDIQKRRISQGVP